jgi:hypothetical protein
MNNGGSRQLQHMPIPAAAATMTSSEQAQHSTSPPNSEFRRSKAKEHAHLETVTTLAKSFVSAA